MNVTIKFSIANPDFSQAYADENNNGMESENNMRFSWAVGYEMEEVLKIEEDVNGEYVMRGKFLTTEEEFEFTIPGMRVYRFSHGNGEISTFAVSEELIAAEGSVRPLQKGLTRYYSIELHATLNPHFDFAMPSEGILLAKNSIPKALLPS